MPIDSPRSTARENALDQAATTPYEWSDPVEHRRKLAEGIHDIALYVRNLPAYAGVWREIQATPETINTSTAWTPITGYTENRPSVSKKATADFTTGEVTLNQTGVYSVSLTISYEGQINRFYEFAARLNGVDPTNPVIRQEVNTNSGVMTVNYTTDLTVTEVPATYLVVVRSEVAATMDFVLGGWSIKRFDYNSPVMNNQKLFT